MTDNDKNKRKYAYARYVGTLVWLVDNIDFLLTKQDGWQSPECCRPLADLRVEEDEYYRDKVYRKRWYLGGPKGIAVEARKVLYASMKILNRIDLYTEIKERYALYLAYLLAARKAIEPIKDYVAWAMENGDKSWGEESARKMMEAAKEGGEYDKDYLRAERDRILKTLMDGGRWSDEEVDKSPDWTWYNPLDSGKKTKSID